jgi:hypothetical protein
MKSRHARRTQRRKLAHVCATLLFLGLAAPRLARANGTENSVDFRAADDLDCSSATDVIENGATVGTLQLLAHCYAARGRLVKAKELSRRAILQMPETDPMREVASIELGTLDERIPRVTIRTVSGAQGVTVRDGAHLLAEGTLGVPLEMDPGRHRFTVRASGRESRTIFVEVAEGSAMELVLVPGPEIRATGDIGAPAAATTAMPNDARSREMDWKRLMGWIAGGLGVAGIGVGATAGLANQPKKSIADKKCDNPSTCMDGRLAMPHGGPSLGAVSAVGWIVGGAGLGTAAYLLLSDDHRTGKQTALAADIYGGGAGVRVSRRF